MANLNYFYGGSNISLSKLIIAIESLSPEALMACNKAIIEAPRSEAEAKYKPLNIKKAEELKELYIEELLSSYEASAYKGSSLEELIEDILLYNSYL